MRFLLTAVVVSFALGCVGTPDFSNQPDSGVDCSRLPPDQGGLTPGVPNGSGAVSGTFSFTARAAYETHQTTSLPSRLPDGGTASIASGSYLSVLLYGAPVVCGGANDAGTYPLVWLAISDPTGSYAAGDYPVSRDGGGWSTALIATTDRDGGYNGGRAKSGAVHLGSSQLCSLSGSFDFQLVLNDGDAGTASGTFDAPYCR